MIDVKRWNAIGGLVVTLTLIALLVWLVNQ
jgi:hypothetical protein